MPMGKYAGRSSMDYKKPFNSKPGEGKMSSSSKTDRLGRNPGQKNYLSIPQNQVPGPGSPTPTQAKSNRGKLNSSH